MKKLYGIFLIPLLLTACTIAENSVIQKNRKPIHTEIISPTNTRKDISTSAFNSHGDFHRVMSLPNLKGFTAFNSPKLVQLEQITKMNGYPYSWIYETSVKSTKKLKIIEFGAFNYINNEWILGDFTGKPFTSVDFINWHDCPNSILENDKPCIDKINWSASKIPYGKTKTAIWYFIGQDINGNLYKAIAPVTLSFDLKK